MGGKLSAPKLQKSKKLLEVWLGLTFENNALYACNKKTQSITAATNIKPKVHKKNNTYPHKNGQGQRYRQNINIHLQVFINIYLSIGRFFMSGFFMLLLLASLVLFVVSLVNPQKGLFFLKPQSRNRKKAFLYLAFAFFFVLAAGVTSDNSEIKMAQEAGFKTVKEFKDSIILLNDAMEYYKYDKDYFKTLNNSLKVYNSIKTNWANTKFLNKS